ncbi:hypothetical protein SNEBB_000921 [Seison nebaliae]|nr:hypothetical protein SNEBB_000921 [Seison nebaliae]
MYKYLKLLNNPQKSLNFFQQFLSFQTNLSTNRSSSSVIFQHRSDISDGVYELLLNRPEARNAINKDMCSLIEEAINECNKSKNMRCLIIGSKVDGTFCSGADLKERLKMKQEDVAGHVKRLRRMIECIAKIPVPVIGAIDGVAVGGGMELALACDLRVISGKGSLGLVETKLAIIPGAGGTQRLTRLLSIAKAKELIFSGRIVKAPEAVMLGLANIGVGITKEVSGFAAYNKALELAEQLGRYHGPIALRMAKKAIDEGYSLSMKEALKVEENCYEQVINTNDRMEGLKAFKDKRPPNYLGN